MSQLFRNNARSTLAGSLASGATSLAVATGEGLKFPTLAGADTFKATIENGSDVEIVKVTARATDTFTIERQQEGTISPALFASGSVISLRITAETIEPAVNHVANPTAAHAASAISNTPSGNLTATTAQGALNELQGDIDAHQADAADAHAASAITNTPAGSISATTVQAAINELDTEKEPANANIAKVNVEQTWTAQQVPKSGALTDGVTINWDGDSNGQVVSVTLGGNRTLAAPTNINENAFYLLRVTQDATGSRTLAWNAAYKFVGGVDPVLSIAAGAVDIFSFVGGATSAMYCVGVAKGLT